MSDDIRLTASELLGELDWLRRLARSLVGDVGADQDLVQQTWLAASGVEGGVSRPWLVSTLRRLAARWHRSEARLRRREQAAARPEAVDTSALLERNEMFGVVLEELRHMDEPYRTALMLLYQEGLTVREAAERAGVREDTLRWRHRQGLERLRGRLDRGPRADWRACFLPLLEFPASDLVRGGAAAATAVGPPALIGGTVMTWKLFSLLTVAAVAVPLGLQALSGSQDEPARDAVETGDDAAADDVPRLAEVASQEPTRLEIESGSPAASVPTISPPPATGPTLAVTVVDAREVPVPGARVWIGESPDPEGSVWESDAEGIALLPMPDPDAGTISACTATLFGRRPFTPRWTGGELQLVMRPDADVSVLVVDERGEPLSGVPVAVIRDKMVKDREKGGERRVFGFKDVVATDADGRALLRHVNHRMRPERKTADWRVGPAILFADRPDVPIVYGDLPKDPVRIVLPPVGSLAVRVLDDEGNPNSAATEARVFIDPQPGQEREVPDLTHQARHSASGMCFVDLVDGVGTIPMIGLGLDLLAEARDAEPTQSTFGMGRGPAAPSADAELVLSPLDDALEIVGYALDAGNAPLANRLLLAEVALGQVGRGFGADRSEVRTDENGRFRVFIEEKAREDWEYFGDRHLHLSLLGGDPIASVGAQCELPDGLVMGANDVGDLVLEPRTPLVAGEARTEDGEPVDIEYVWLITYSQITNRRTDFVLDARTIVDGNRFAIFGESVELDRALDEVLQLQLTSKGKPGRRQNVTEGALDLAFVFERAGELTGRVLLGPEHDADDYFVAFRTRERPGDYLAGQQVNLAHNGRFTLGGLPLREGNLEVRDWSTKTLLAIVPGVVPSADSDGVDPRLEGIVLMSSVDEYSLEVTDLQGKGIRTARLESDRLPAGLSSYGAGIFRWRAAGGSIDGFVSAPGYLRQRLTLTPGEHAVTLQRGPEVIVRPTPPIDLPRGARFTVLLVGGERYERVFLRRRSDGSYIGFASGGGRYRVLGRLNKGSALLAEMPLSGDPQAEIDVPEAGSSVPFEVPFDRESFVSRWPAD